MLLHQKYRPKDWADYVGQPRAVDEVRALIESPEFDRGAFWIDAAGNNNSGVGKTTLANLIADHLADEFFIVRLSGDEVDKAAVRKMRQDAHYTSWSDRKRFRVWIVDEAHAMTRGAVDAFLPFLDDLPRHSAVIFTTTRAVDEGLFGDDCGPFASRTFRVKLTNQGLSEAFAKRAQEIARLEGLDGRPLASYVRLVKQQKNNLRGVLSEIQRGAMRKGGE